MKRFPKKNILKILTYRHITLSTDYEADSIKGENKLFK